MLVVVLSTGFLAGNLAVLWLCSEPLPLWSAAWILFLSFLIILYPCQVERILPLRIFLLAFALGFVWTNYAAAEQLGKRLAPNLEGLDLDAVIRVSSIPVKQNLAIRFDAEVLSSEASLPDKIRLRWYTKRHNPQLGDAMTVRVRLKQPRGFINPGGFDYERYLFHNRIGAVGYIRHHYQIRKPTGFLSLGDRWRGSIYRTLTAQLRDRVNAGPILALAMGERGGMEPYHWQQLRMTGTSHLFAISGLHVGLVYGLVFFIARWFWRWSFLPLRSWPAQKFAALAALPAAAAYAWLAGFSVPTQRALLMLSFFAAVFLSGRTVTLLYGIAAALLVVLFLDPLQSLSVSFWLTFLACLMIAVCLSTTFNRPAWQRSIVLQIWLPIALLPVTFLFFGQAASLASLANLLAIPYVSFLLAPCILLAVVFLPWWSLSSFLLAQADRLLSLFWRLSEWMTGMEFLYWRQQPLVWAYPLAFLGVLGLVVCARPHHKVAALALMLPLSASSPVSGVSSGEFRVTFLDVGQALSVVVQTQNHNLLYDTGFLYASGFDAGEQIVRPYLHSQAIHELDALVVSHGDNDHAGGMPSVLRHFKPARRWSSAPEFFSEHDFSFCRKGIAWSWDGVRFEFLHPTSNTALQGNEASCVLKVHGARHALLLTADIEKQAEASLLKNPEVLSSSLLLVPHHGSLTSSSPAFIRAVEPILAIVTSGWRNRFGLPKDEVMRRYRDRCITVINTADVGSLSIRVPADQPVPIVEWMGRRDQKRLWRLPANSRVEQEPHCRTRFAR